MRTISNTELSKNVDTEDIEIREASDSDLEPILALVAAAFGREDEAVLVRELLQDPTTEPRLSLVAHNDGQLVGHILFTAAHITGTAASPSTRILAPLAVTPTHQKEGIGRMLTEEGLALLAASGTDLVFVLGHPSYYPRFGFEPAGRLGFDAPYPIPKTNADAWMVLALKEGLIGSVAGTVACAQTLDKEEDWRE